MHDIIVIGGGPAGLSAALNTSAEGLSTLLLERSSSLGGQAGTSSRIENYLGFPNGVSGADLTRHAVYQAKRLGADLRPDHDVVSLTYNPATETWLTECAAGTQHVSRAIIAAVGVDYRRLDIPIEPIGDVNPVLYGAPAESHEECKGHPVVVIGGGNSAGQAALNLAKIGADVKLLVRRPLRMTMSHYLIERITLEPNITAILGEAVEIIGATVWYKDTATGGRIASTAAEKVFAYIGTTPRTEFIHNCCRIEGPGFIETDSDFRANPAGLFAAGDVRSGSFKRVAAAAGEGAIAAAAAWRYIYDVK